MRLHRGVQRDAAVVKDARVGVATCVRARSSRHRLIVIRVVRVEVRVPGHGKAAASDGADERGVLVAAEVRIDVAIGEERPRAAGAVRIEDTHGGGITAIRCDTVKAGARAIVEGVTHADGHGIAAIGECRHSMAIRVEVIKEGVRGGPADHDARVARRAVGVVGTGEVVVGVARVVLVVLPDDGESAIGQGFDRTRYVFVSGAQVIHPHRAAGGRACIRVNTHIGVTTAGAVAADADITVAAVIRIVV